MNYNSEFQKLWLSGLGIPDSVREKAKRENLDGTRYDPVLNAQSEDAEC